MYHFGKDEEDDNEKKYGKPPFQSLTGNIFEGIPKRSLKYKRRNNILDPKYKFKYPNPNYYNFERPEYIDERGREYAVARSEDNIGLKNVVSTLQENGTVSNDSFDRESSKDGQEKSLVMWMRIPIAASRSNVRDKLGFPDASGQKLTLYHYDTQGVYEAVTDGMFHGDKRKTAFCILRKFRWIEDSKSPPDYFERIVVPEKNKNKNKKKQEKTGRKEGFY